MTCEVNPCPALPASPNCFFFVDFVEGLNIFRSPDMCNTGIDRDLFQKFQFCPRLCDIVSHLKNNKIEKQGIPNYECRP